MNETAGFWLTKLYSTDCIKDDFQAFSIWYQADVLQQEAFHRAQRLDLQLDAIADRPRMLKLRKMLMEKIQDSMEDHFFSR